MANVFDIALVFSPHEWVEELHRYCTNTGTLRIKSLVYDSSVLQTETYDACIISDTHPALSAGLVKQLHNSSKRIFGVCDDSSNGRNFLSELGVDGIFSSRISTEDLCLQIQEFLDRSADAQESIDFDQLQNLEIDQDSTMTKRQKVSSTTISVVGSGGTGCTEISLVLASRLIDSIVVDSNFENPSIAPRVGLSIEPHIIGAIESATNYREDLSKFAQRMKTTSVIVGISHSSFALNIKPYELEPFISELGNLFSNVVFDLGNISGNNIFSEINKTTLNKSDFIVLVGEPSPVGVLRILEKTAYLHSIATEYNSRFEIIVVINKCPKNANLISGIVAELTDIEQISNVFVLPFSSELLKQVWKSEVRQPRSWGKQIDKLLNRLSAEPIDTSPLLDKANYAVREDGKKVWVDA